MSSNKHEYYELLNLLGYGLAKFDKEFVGEFSFSTKQSFYDSFVELGIVETSSVVKNRQDLFDPFFDNGRKGWWQKGDAYMHRKVHIDDLYGQMTCAEYAEAVKAYLNEHLELQLQSDQKESPIIKSKYRQLQETGKQAEYFFMQNFQKIEAFTDGKLEDARLFGDGYDFQIAVGQKYYLTEVKGVTDITGKVRLTQNEYIKADEFGDRYGLIVVSNLNWIPKMTPVFNPLNVLALTVDERTVTQTFYISENRRW